MSATEFIFGLRSWKARAAFVLGRLAIKAGLPLTMQNLLNGLVSGRFESKNGIFDLRADAGRV